MQEDDLMKERGWKHTRAVKLETLLASVGCEEDCGCHRGELARRLKKAMEAIELLQSCDAPCEICYETGCTGNSSCHGCRDAANQTCHNRAYAREQKATALIREIKGSE